MIAAGCLLLAAGCTARQSVSPIPASVGTTIPPQLRPSSPVSSAALARSVPVRLSIPVIGVNAPVMQLGLGPGDALAVPPLADHNLAGWWDGGPSPGQDGPAVIVGHIDSASGASVFYDLRYLKAGDRVTVTLADGKTATFTITGLQQTLKTAFPTQAVYGSVPYPALRLITCGGTFDYATGHYLSSIIVFASRT